MIVMKLPFSAQKSFEKKEAEFLQIAPQQLITSYLYAKNDLRSDQFESLLNSFSKMLG
jgi:hypothetical protein